MIPVDTKLKQMLQRAAQQLEIAALCSGDLKQLHLNNVDDILFDMRNELKPHLGEKLERKPCSECGGDTHDIPSVGGKLAAECNTCNHVQDRY